MSEDTPLDPATLRWAERITLSALSLWKERRDKMARGTDRSSVDAVCQVLQGLASVMGGQAEQLDAAARNQPGDNINGSEAQTASLAGSASVQPIEQRTGDETV